MRAGRYILYACMLTLLPVAGLLLYGAHLEPYMEFPPRNSYVVHLGFSWPWFVVMGAGIGLLMLALGSSLLFTWWRHRGGSTTAGRAFPRWGWASVACLLAVWGLAWTRLPGMAWLQPHTFTPLWLAYIVLVNAMTYARQGTCMLTHQRTYWLSLFPLSAGFWWFFEFLNRFTQNWYYEEALSYGPGGYFLAATLAFSTVLPAVLGTYELLLSYSWFSEGYGSGWRLRLPFPRVFAVVILGLGALSLLALGVYPNALFPVLWLGPVMILAGLEALFGETTMFSKLSVGDWRPLVGTMVAALICGFFWELWNSRSQAKWFYDIPLVHRFMLFEMPILGYAGYLTFGWECGLVGNLLDRYFNHSTTTTSDTVTGRY